MASTNSLQDWMLACPEISTPGGLPDELNAAERLWSRDLETQAHRCFVDSTHARVVLKLNRCSNEGICFW